MEDSEAAERIRKYLLTQRHGLLSRVSPHGLFLRLGFLIAWQEAQRVPNEMDAKRPTPRHLTTEMLKVKDKDRILKAQEKSSYLPTGEFP